MLPHSLEATEEGRAKLQQAIDLVSRHDGNVSGAARELGVPRRTMSHRYDRAVSLGYVAGSGVFERTPTALDAHYSIEGEDLTPQAAWDAHAGAMERKLAEVSRRDTYVLKRPSGPYAVAHFTDTHIDDNSAPLRVLAQDIQDCHDLGAIMLSGGDVLNNWPEGGKLAKQWAQQDCTKPAALLRAQHYIELLSPDVWVDGNHEEMNPYLSNLFDEWLPDKTFREAWTCHFKVVSEGGRTLRCSLSHKHQKGSSWFHKSHGQLREMLEGAECDLYFDGHLHCEGRMTHSLPERGHHAALCASAGYKPLDKYAERISRGGQIPKMRGRYHIAIVDPSARHDEDFVTLFNNARQAGAFLNGLQNLREI